MAATLTSGSRSAAFCLGRLYRDQNRLDEATAQFEQALAAEPARTEGVPRSVTAERTVSTADILYRLGEIELARGNVKGAGTFTQEALQLEPRHYWALFQEAMILAREGNRQAAIAELERLLEWYPAHGAAMLNLGLLRESTGDLGAAEHWYLQARKVLPNPDLADTQLRRLKAVGASRR